MKRIQLTAALLATLMVLGIAGCEQRPQSPTGDQPMERSEGAPDSGMTPGGAGDTSGMQQSPGGESQPGGAASQ